MGDGPPTPRKTPFLHKAGGSFETLSNANWPTNPVTASWPPWGSLFSDVE